VQLQAPAEEQEVERMMAR